MFLVWLSLFFFALVAGLMFYSIIRYRRRSPNDVTPYITHHLGLEVTWTIVPLIIVIGIFFWGFNGYMQAFVAPGEALEITVTGKKWQWQFEYPNGVRTINEFAVPVNRPVKLILQSEDVLHNFYLPTFRVKHDVVPGRYTELWFEATQKGEHVVECAFYCGSGHSKMYAKALVMEDDKYKEWVDNGGLIEDPAHPIPPAKRGARVYESKGCNACHSLDGTRGQGPSWKGIWGQEHKMQDGSVYKVDENYVRTSILNPHKMVVAGFQDVMPVFQGLLTDKDIDGVIAYIKELK